MLQPEGDTVFEGAHPRVGPGAAFHVGAGAEKRLERILKGLHHGGGVLLHLPAMKGPPVKTQGHEQVPQGKASFLFRAGGFNTSTGKSG